MPLHAVTELISSCMQLLQSLFTGTDHLLQLALGQGRYVTSLYLFSRKVFALVMFFPIALAFQAK